MLSPPSPLLHIPVDVLLAIARHLGVADVLTLRQTCRELCSATHLPSLWHILLQTQILDKNIPIPGVGVDPALHALLPDTSDDPAAKKLEAHLRLALQLHHNWRSPAPTCYSQDHLAIPDFPQSLTGHNPNIPDNQALKVRNIGVRFIRGPRGRNCLVSVTLLRERHGVSFLKIEAIDVSVAPPARVDSVTRVLAGGFVFSDDVYSSTILAINEPGGSNPRIVIMSIDFMTQPPHLATTTTIPIHIKTIHAFSGSKIIASDYPADRLIMFDQSAPDRPVHFLDIQPDNPLPVAPWPQHLQAQAPGTPDRFMSAVIAADIIIIFTSYKVQLYHLPNLEADSQTSITPIVQHRWQWPLDSISTSTETNSQNASRTARKYPQINVLVRHSSLFPWPVNLLHQYIIKPDPHYNPALPKSSINIPYIFPPSNIRTVAAPVRLFAQTNSVLGPYGTAVWIDNYTEDYFGPSGDGQRLAGLFYTSNTPHSPAGSTGTAADSSGEDPGETPLESALSATATSEASTVFATMEHDGWVTLALCEEEGKIAAGLVNGEVHVFSYAQPDPGPATASS